MRKLENKEVKLLVQDYSQEQLCTCLLDTLETFLWKLFEYLLVSKNNNSKNIYQYLLCPRFWEYKFLKDFIYLFLEREEERGKEKERNIDVREKHQPDASRTFLTGDRTHNSGMCPDQASNWRSLTLRDDAHPTEPYQSGLRIQILIATTAF